MNQRRSFDLDLCYPFLELKPVNPMPINAKNSKKPKVPSKKLILVKSGSDPNLKQRISSLDKTNFNKS